MDSSTPAASPLLELAAAYPMHTLQRRTASFFVPDSQMLFHVLSLCDQMMNSTRNFLNSCPAWMPIVSQLYISVLWNLTILRVMMQTGHGSHFANILNEFHFDEYMIPGPLIPFFQSLAASKAPFDWIGDIVPIIPGFDQLWSAAEFAPTNDYARQIPFPVIILDQLYHFATHSSPYSDFEWYRNVFSLGAGTHRNRLRLGPQLCGSLFTGRDQFNTARGFWNSVLGGGGFTRVNAADGQPPFQNYVQLLGFRGQEYGKETVNWFEQVTIVMQRYSQFFHGSPPLKSVLPIGINGASLIYGTPNNIPEVRNWIYPTSARIEPFTTSRFTARREIPEGLRVQFAHSHHNLEKEAEKYALLTHTNMRWYYGIEPQNNYAAIQAGAIHSGDYWKMMACRFSPRVGLKTQYSQIIASRYHQDTANNTE